MTCRRFVFRINLKNAHCHIHVVDENRTIIGWFRSTADSILYLRLIAGSHWTVTFRFTGDHDSERQDAWIRDEFETAISQLDHARGKIISRGFLFYLCMSRQNADAITGDLEEGYMVLRKKFGRRKANFWYWTQTVMSLGPVVWAWGKQKALKPVLGIVAWALGKGLIGHDGWLAAVVELWKRVRS